MRGAPSGGSQGDSLAQESWEENTMRNCNAQPTRHACRSFIGGISRLLLLALLVFASAPSLSAFGSGETGVITLIPTKVTQDGAGSPPALKIPVGSQGEPHVGVILEFELNSLPIGAKVTAAHLILVAKEKSPPASESITVNRVEAGGKPFGEPTQGASFGEETLDQHAPDKDAPAVWQGNKAFLNQFPVLRGSLWLKLTTSEYEGRIWHALESRESRYWPRLVLEYSLANQPAVTQSNGLPDVHSPRAFLDRHSKYQLAYGIRPFPKAWSHAPAFYFNWVYIITDNSGQKGLLELGALGNPLRPVALPPAGDSKQNLGQHVLASKDSRLSIVGDGRILVYGIDAKLDPPLPTLLANSRFNGLNPAVPPALGPAGSLYVVNGLEVFGLNPALQELWKVTLKDKTTSRVTVGPSGKFVYLITREEGLVAINAQTGDYVTVPLSNQETLRHVDNPGLHAPVVIQHPDGTEKIYVAANSVNDGVFACFDNRNTAYRKSSSWEISLAKSWELQGLWSQPIPDQLPPWNPSKPEKANENKKVYAVRVLKGQGTLEAIDWLDGSTKTALSLKVTGSSYLLNGGNLTMDGDGNCFVWNGEGSIGLYAFGAAFSGRLGNMESAIPAKARLLFGNDGTLYAQGVDDGILRAIVPQYTLGADTGTDISSPTHLRVDGTVGRATTLKAGGSVLLGPGFTVQKGATLKISTGAAKKVSDEGQSGGANQR